MSREDGDSQDNHGVSGSLLFLAAGSFAAERLHSSEILAHPTQEPASLHLELVIPEVFFLLNRFRRAAAHCIYLLLGVRLVPCPGALLDP